MNAMTGNENVPPVMSNNGRTRRASTTMFEAQETNAHIDEKGVVSPSLPTLYAVMAMQSEFNPRMIEIIRELTGSAIIAMPSSVKGLDSPRNGRIETAICDAGNASARERIQLMRMAWDFIGSELAITMRSMRRVTFLVKIKPNQAYDYNRATALVDKALALTA